MLAAGSSPAMRMLVKVMRKTQAREKLLTWTAERWNSSRWRRQSLRKLRVADSTNTTACKVAPKLQITAFRTSNPGFKSCQVLGFFLAFFCSHTSRLFLRSPTNGVARIFLQIFPTTVSRGVIRTHGRVVRRLGPFEGRSTN